APPAPAPAPPAPAPTPRAAPLVPRARTPVLVLNGNGVNGAAARTAPSVRRRGYPVTATANAPRHDYLRSVVMFKPGFVREAARLGRDLKVETLQPFDPLVV